MQVNKSEEEPDMFFSKEAWRALSLLSTTDTNNNKHQED